MADPPGEPYGDLVMEVAADVPWPTEPLELRHRRRGPGAWAEYLALRGAQRAAGHLPPRLLDPALGALARLGRALDRRHTRAARDFVHAALPDLSRPEVDELVLASWRHLSRLALTSDGLGRAVMGRRLGDHYRIEPCEGLEDLRASGRGCLFLTAHVGNWEAIAPPLVALGFGPLYAVGKAPRNDPLARHVQRSREATGGRLLPRRGAMQAVPRVVRAGGSVILLLDHRARVKPVHAPFFGRPAACDRSAGVLLRRVAAPLVFVACYTTGERFRFQLRFARILEPEELAGLRPEEVMARINHQLEELILAHPEQYFWLHDRYKGAPPPHGGAPSVHLDAASTHGVPG